MAEKGKGGRVGILDEVRGVAIILVVIYHTLYDLVDIFGVNMPFFYSDWFNSLRDIFAGSFVFVAGASSRYSKNNMKRGIQIFFIGMVMTFVVPFFLNGSTIKFGILHLLGVCMMIFGLWEKGFDLLPALVTFIISVLLFAVTFNIRMGYIGFDGLFQLYLPQGLYDSGYMFPLGLPSKNFSSADYFPLMPWFFLFTAGTAFGVWAKNGSLPKFCYNTHCKWLANIGKHTIWIYVLHQPVIFLILTLIFK